MYTDDVYNRWHAIAYPTGRLGLKRKLRMWQELFDDYFVEARLHVPFEDVPLITVTGQSLLMQDKQYKRAREIGELFLQLPEAESNDVAYSMHRSRKAACLICEGRDEEGMSILESMPENHHGLRSHTRQCSGVLRCG